MLKENLVAGPQKTKPSLARYGAKVLNKRSYLALLIVFFLGTAGFAVYWKFHESKIDRTEEGNNKAVALAEQGRYKDAATELIKVYNQESQPLLKANLAYKVGVKYYDAGYYSEGKKWLGTSATAYEKAGDSQTAADVRQSIINFDQIHSSEFQDKMFSEENEKRRGDVKDSGL